MNFGGLHLVTEEVTTVQTTATRSTEAQVYDLILSDLLKAETLLPKTQADVGRAQQSNCPGYVWQGSTYG